MQNCQKPSDTTCTLKLLFLPLLYLGPNGVKNDESLENAAASKDEGGHTSTYDGKRKVVNVNDIDIDVDGLLDGLLDGYDGLLKRDQGIC